MTIITLPRDIDEPLKAEARRRGTTPEQLALDTLRQSFAPDGTQKPAEEMAATDPLSLHIGAFHTGVVDWAERHDQYLGQELLKQLRGETSRDSDG